VVQVVEEERGVAVEVPISRWMVSL
jgi:hypothetical protein